MHRFDCLSLLGRRRFKEWALKPFPLDFMLNPSDHLSQAT